ncbi:MAG TPA: phosphatase PAP2-related protein [Bacteroidia bacterium]|nr:phosphatase PAP2-related protein [Bacteroidia bacterium]
MRGKWLMAWKHKPYKYALLALLVFTLIVSHYYQYFLLFNEGRNGIDFNDPVLKYFTPINLSIPIFIAMYSAAILTAFHVIYTSPILTLKLALAYTLLLIWRMFSLYFLPLNPPPGLIILNDPFLKHFVYSARNDVRDLFFSGHTSSTFLFFLVVKNKKLKMYLMACVLFLAVALLAQHLHYSIDILAAPVFAYLAYFPANWIIKKANYENVIS